MTMNTPQSINYVANKLPWTFEHHAIPLNCDPWPSQNRRVAKADDIETILYNRRDPIDELVRLNKVCQPFIVAYYKLHIMQFPSNWTELAVVLYPWLTHRNLNISG